MSCVYLVLRDGKGMHEPEAVMSIWTNSILADDEVERLQQLSTVRFGADAASCFYAIRVGLNKQNDGHSLT